MDLRRHLVKGVWALVDKGFSGLYGFALLFLVVGQLPREEYGTYVLAFTVTNFALLFNKSFVLSPLTKYEAEGVPRPQMLGNVFLYSLTGQIILAALIFSLSSVLADLLNAPGLEQLLRLVPLVILGFFFRDYSIAYLQAHQRVKTMVMVDAVYFGLCSAIFAYFAATGTFDRAVQAVYGHIIASSISSLTAFFPVAKGMRINFKPSMKEFKRMVKFGRYSLSLGIGEITFYQLDLTLLAYFYSPLVVAQYNAAKLIYRLYTLLSQSLNLLMFPGASKLSSQKRLPDLKEVYEKVIAYYFLLIIPLNIALFILAEVFLNLLYGGKYPDSVPILRIFLMLSFLEPLYSISLVVLYGLGRPDRVFRPMLWTVPVFILSNIILIPRLGAIGAAVSFGIANILIDSYFLKSLKEIMGVTLSGIFTRMLNIIRVVCSFAFKKIRD
ncbi:oligosaccharide flippase family protein [bacterium]|nr:oligosaccharide flippase family protein [bacterium]